MRVKDIDYHFYDIIGYEGLYKINPHGVIMSCEKNIDNLWGGKSKRKEKILKGCKDKDGYLRVTLTKNKKQKTYFVHRLVAINFLTNEDKEKNIINHIDKNKDNNHYTNLEWCTHKYNVTHSIEEYIGSSNGNSKINENIVLIIKKLLKNKKNTHQYISNILNISKYIVSDISRGKNWNHVYDEDTVSIKEIKETFNDYKKTSLYICGNYCKLNCDNCFNELLKNKSSIKLNTNDLIETKILSNTFIDSIVLSGLNWFDEFENMLEFISNFRNYSNMDIVVYTGYNEEEIKDKINVLKIFDNIIVKFGRYVADSEPIYDDVLGIELASKNQYAENIS